MKSYIKSKEEINFIREGGHILGSILKKTAILVKPGVSTLELDEYADAEIRKAGGKPSFLGYGSKKNPFPAALCTSINDAVVHGIPSDTDILRAGDIIGLDIGMEYKGFFTDTAVTVGVGKLSGLAKKLMQTTEHSLLEAIKQAKPGNRIGDIGYVSQLIAEKEGFSVVRDMVGHGVGYAVHEDPAVPGYGRAGKGLLLEEGMVLAIEPMVCEHKPHVFFDTDGWTIRTHDGGLTAHFEHTIVINKNGAEILTPKKLS